MIRFRRMFRLHSLLIVLIWLISTMHLQAGDWPQWRGPNRDAISLETGLLQEWTDEGPKLVWHAKGLGRGYASIVTSNGTVITMGKRDSDVLITALDAHTAQQIWQMKIGTTERIPCSTPTIDGEQVYAVDPDGDLTCLKTATGEILWQKSFLQDFSGRMMSGRGYGESPLIDGDKLICTPGGDEAMMVALHKLTGALIWKASIPDLGPKGRDGSSFPSAVVTEVSGIRQYVQFAGRGLIGIEAETGRFLWGYNDLSNATANIPTPIIQGDLVFAANGYGAGSVLLQLVPEGKHGVKAVEKYRLSGGRFQNHHGGIVLVGEHIYGGHGSNNGLPTCLDLKTGKRLWRRRGPGTGSAAVTYADGRLYFRYQNGVMALIEASSEGYQLRGRFNIPGAGGDSWAHPVVSHGRLYLREQDDLWVYDIAGDRSKNRTKGSHTTTAPGSLAPDLQKLGATVHSLDRAHPPQYLRFCNFLAGGSDHESQQPCLLVTLRDRHLTNESTIAPDVIAAIKRFSAPFALSLAGTRIEDKSLELLNQLPHLRALDLESCQQITNSALKNLQTARALEALRLTGTQITDGGLDSLHELESLVSLDLEVCDGITDMGLVHLGRMNQLRALNLKKSGFETIRITDHGLKHLRRITALKSLDLYGNSITNSGMEYVGELVHLEELNLSLTQVTDAGLEHLGSLRKLRKLELLYSVGFAGPQVTDAGLSHLQTLTDLQSLNLVGANITDDGLTRIQRLSKLRKLNLINTNVSDAGIARLHEKLKKCRIKR